MARHKITILREAVFHFSFANTTRLSTYTGIDWETVHDILENHPLVFKKTKFNDNPIMWSLTNDAYRIAYKQHSGTKKVSQS
jgi:hypothetical protein